LTLGRLNDGTTPSACIVASIVAPFMGPPLSECNVRICGWTWCSVQASASKRAACSALSSPSSSDDGFVEARRPCACLCTVGLALRRLRTTASLKPHRRNRPRVKKDPSPSSSDDGFVEAIGLGRRAHPLEPALRRLRTTASLKRALDDREPDGRPVLSVVFGRRLR